MGLPWFSKNPLWRDTVAFVFALLLSLSAGCGDRSEAEKLAKSGVVTANNLADYYDSLARDTLDIWEMQAFYDALPADGLTAAQSRQLQMSTAQESLLQLRISALNRRARLARRLASSYSALLQLSSYNVSAEVKGAATGLGEELKVDFPSMPGSSLVASSLFGNIIGDLARLEQSRDIKKVAKVLLDAVTKLKAMFENEEEAYQSIERDRGSLFNDVTKYLIEHKLVIAWPLARKVPDSLGLEWASPSTPVEDPRTIAALIQVAKVRTLRLAMLSSAAAGSTEQSLASLLDGHRRILAGEPLSPDQILDAVQKAQAYLDEIAKLRGIKKDADKK
ncbi:MAG TPA: hypothetical protein VGL91_25815 [Acidobacteriota bacterium]|jgi:hypothetical protein